MIEEKDISRSMILSGEITDESVKPLIEKIAEINEADEQVRSMVQEGKYQVKPIRFIINSYGGEVHAALALIGVIESSMTPVHTIVYGKAMSAALWVALAGHVRFVHHLSTYMYHEMADWNIGKIESQKRHLEESKKLMKKLDDYMLARTNIPKDKLEKNALSDWYFTADEALTLGVADYLMKATYTKIKQEPKIKKPKKKKQEAQEQ